MKRWSISPVGGVFAVVGLLAILASVLGGQTLQLIGFVVLVFAVLAVAVDSLDWLRGGSRALPTIANMRGRASGRGPTVAAPEYVQDNPEAPADVWEQVRQGYRDKERGEGDWRAR